MVTLLSSRKDHYILPFIHYFINIMSLYPFVNYLILSMCIKQSDDNIIIIDYNRRFSRQLTGNPRKSAQGGITVLGCQNEQK